MVSMKLRSHLIIMIVHFLPHRYYPYLGVVSFSNHFLGLAGGWRYLGLPCRGGSKAAFEGFLVIQKTTNINMLKTLFSCLIEKITWHIVRDTRFCSFSQSF